METMRTSIRQEERVRAIEQALNTTELEDFRQELDEAPKHIYSMDYVWDVIHRWEGPQPSNL